jgi:general secretion pathway protein H
MISRTERSEDGFTLLEMLVVLAVLGLALALIGTRSSTGGTRLTEEAVAAELAGTLREARSRAITEDRPVRVTIDLAAKSYRIDDDPPAAMPSVTGIDLLTTVGEVASRADASIRFDPDGSSTGGRIELAFGARKLMVGVDWLTGRVGVVDAR